MRVNNPPRVLPKRVKTTRYTLIVDESIKILSTLIFINVGYYKHPILLRRRPCRGHNHTYGIGKVPQHYGIREVPMQFLSSKTLISFITSKPTSECIRDPTT